MEFAARIFIYRVTQTYIHTGFGHITDIISNWRRPAGTLLRYRTLVIKFNRTKRVRDDFTRILWLHINTTGNNMKYKTTNIYVKTSCEIYCYLFSLWLRDLHNVHFVSDSIVNIKEDAWWTVKVAWVHWVLRTRGHLSTFMRKFSSALTQNYHQVGVYWTSRAMINKLNSLLNLFLYFILHKSKIIIFILQSIKVYL